MDILKHIKVVPDFPKAGINFYDIGSLMTQPPVWAAAIESLDDMARPYAPDIIMGIESRGFLVGLPVAQALGVPFGMIRKKGKLPGAVISLEYDLEYGSDCIEMQKGVVESGARVVILDDLLATGGTMAATGALVRQAGAQPVCGIAMIELDGLGGRAKLDFPFKALVKAAG